MRIDYVLMRDPLLLAVRAKDASIIGFAHGAVDSGIQQIRLVHITQSLFEFACTQPAGMGIPQLECAHHDFLHNLALAVSTHKFSY